MLNIEVEELFTLEEIDISEIEKYPVKLLYQQRGLKYANVIFFEDENKLSKFLKMRKLISKGIKEKKHKMSKIRFYEYEKGE